jgi:hypothetical protein
VTSGPGLADLRRGLVSAARFRPDAAIHHRALAHWLAGNIDGLAEITQEAMAHLAEAGTRSVRDVAALAFALDVRQSAPAVAVLTSGLGWLADRSWFQPQRPLTLEADGVAALGVALALARSAEPAPAWFNALATKSATSLSLTEFDRSLFVLATHLTRATGRQDQVNLLAEVRIVFADVAGLSTPEEVFQTAWTHMLQMQVEEGREIEAALLLRAFDLTVTHSLPARSGRLEPLDVLRILEGVHRSFRRWTWEQQPRTRTSTAERWNMQNEYHVQNLLWAILAPLFQDLNDEETLPPVGQKNPRIDLSIPSLGTIVEVKFLRKGVAMQHVIEEIAEDVGLYRTDPRWTSLIPFVCDDSSRTEEHAKLVAGLNKLDMVIGSVVVPRPGMMAVASTTEAPSAKV